MGYRIADNKVVEMVINSDTAKKFGISREEEIYIRFGKPDEIKKENNSLYSQSEYNYIKKGLIVRYMDELGVSINIFGK